MKNIISMTILMIGLFVSHPELVSGTPVELTSSRHPELVSGPPVELVSVSHPELVSGTSELVSVSHPELVSGPAELVSASYPGTTISATASSSIEASIGDLVPIEKGNFFTRNWGALIMGLLGFADLVTRLTPSEKDNSIVNFLISVFNAIIPNLKKGGGRL